MNEDAIACILDSLSLCLFKERLPYSGTSVTVSQADLAQRPVPRSLVMVAQRTDNQHRGPSSSEVQSPSSEIWQTLRKLRESAQNQPQTSTGNSQMATCSYSSTSQSLITSAAQKPPENEMLNHVIDVWECLNGILVDETRLEQYLPTCLLMMCFLDTCHSVLGSVDWPDNMKKRIGTSELIKNVDKIVKITSFQTARAHCTIADAEPSSGTQRQRLPTTPSIWAQNVVADQLDNEGFSWTPNDIARMLAGTLRLLGDDNLYAVFDNVWAVWSSVYLSKMMKEYYDRTSVIPHESSILSQGLTAFSRVSTWLNRVWVLGLHDLLTSYVVLQHHAGQELPLLTETSQQLRLNMNDPMVTCKSHHVRLMQFNAICTITHDNKPKTLLDWMLDIVLLMRTLQCCVHVKPDQEIPSASSSNLIVPDALETMAPESEFFGSMFQEEVEVKPVASAPATSTNVATTHVFPWSSLCTRVLSTINRCLDAGLRLPKQWSFFLGHAKFSNLMTITSIAIMTSPRTKTEISKAHSSGIDLVPSVDVSELEHWWSALSLGAWPREDILLWIEECCRLSALSDMAKSVPINVVSVMAHAILTFEDSPDAPFDIIWRKFVSDLRVCR